MASEMDECEVRGMMAITLRVLRLFGLAPLRFSRVDSGVYLVSTSRTILIIGTIGLFVIQSLLFLAYYFYVMDYLQKFITMTYNFLLFLNIIWTSLLLSVAFVGGVKRMKHLFILLKQIQEIQTKLTYNTSMEPKAHTVLTILVLSILINLFVHTLYTYLLTYGTNKEQFTPVVYVAIVSFIQISLVILLELQYIVLGLSIYLVVKTINYQMSQIIEKSIGSETITDDLTYKLQSLFQCYLAICSIVNKMNQSEGLMMISLIFREVVHIFMLTYLLCGVALSYLPPTWILQILALTMMLLHTGSRTVILTEMGYRLQCEINNYKTLLTEMMWRQCMNVTLQRKLNNYVYHFLLKQPAVSPLEIITISRPLIATCSRKPISEFARLVSNPFGVLIHELGMADSDTIFSRLCSLREHTRIVGANISFMIIILQFTLEDLY